MTARLWDCHCHLQDPRLAGRVPELLDRARAAGVEQVVCCATREEDWDPVLDLARQEPMVLPMLGMHPWHAAAAAPGWLGRLRSRLTANRAGLGECGLDFALGQEDRAAQEAACADQLRLAVALDLPVAIHCVRAWGPLTTLLRAVGIPAAGALVHAFNGSREVALEMQAFGLYLSFGPTAPGARRGPEALAALAADQILVETDAPGGARDEREPAQVAEVLEAAARIRGVAAETLAAQLRRNAQWLFRRMQG